MKLYCIVDNKAKHVVSVFQAVNNEAAERSFLMLLTGPQNLFTDFPEDFSLYPLGDVIFDKNSVIISAQDSENLREHGFNVLSYKVTDPLKLGSDYDKRYLAIVRKDRFALVSSEESNNDDREESSNG